MIELRKVEEADLDVLYENQSDPVAAAMAGFGGARERDAFLAHWTTNLADAEVVARVVILDGSVAGDIVSWKRDGRRFVGYWINREMWGRGVATSALGLMIGELTERPLHAWVVLSNVGSRRVLEKAGFRVVDPQPPPNQTDVPERLLVLP